MKKGHTYMLIAVLIVSASGCTKFLEREYDSYVDMSRTYTSYEKTSQALVNVYRYLPDGLNRIGSDAMYDAATDDAEFAVETNAIQRFNAGSWSPQYNPDDLWNSLYTGIRYANEFIENVHNVNLDNYRLDPNNQTEYQNRLKDLDIWENEARFLRAFFYFELLKRYGPVPIVTSVLPVSGDYSDVGRPSLDKVVEFICTECDKAAGGLETYPWRDKASAYGRATKGAALALKSRLLLYAASPLYMEWTNTDESYLPSDKDKWKAAADAAKEVIDLNVYTLYGDYEGLFTNNISNNEFIFQKRYANSMAFETLNFPVSFGGTGGTNPSLNLMEAYELKDGTPFSWDDENCAAHPFIYRDDRFRATFLVNGDTWKDGSVEAYRSGKDGAGQPNATKTGFYLRKYMNEDVNIQTGGNSMGHVWPYFRLAEIYLNYAEALNEYDPGNADIVQYLNLVRRRAGQPAVEALPQAEMREKIRAERRVELAFEEHRAWDVRRWKIASSTLGADLRGLEITRDPASEELRRASLRKAATRSIPESEIPEGWYYYDGDEFNASAIDNSYWGLYGSDGPVGNESYGQPTGNVQTYRAAQASIVKEGSMSFVRLHATKDDNPPKPAHASVADRDGWWSAALSSRDADKYGYPAKFYPLHARIEVRAKVEYLYGIWNGSWCRYYDGASYAELDMQEFFVKTWEGQERRLSQALHLHDNDKGSEVSESTLGVNVNGYGRHAIMDFDPGADFHVYGVQIDPDPEAPEEHVIISYLLDGEVTNTFKTRDYGDRYNTFVKKAFQEGRTDRAWDIAITAQIGGKDDNGIGYPEDRDPDLRNVDMDVDWVRVFTREPLDPDAPPEPEYPEVEGYSYAVNVVEKRAFEPKMYWYPIPESEIMQTGWDQNVNW